MEYVRRFGPWVLVFLLGLGGGVGLAALAGDGEPEPSPTPTTSPSPRPGADLDRERVVVFEAADAEFPVEGAAFTESVEIGPDEGCDKAKLLEDLDADPQRRRAWREVLELDEGELRPFVDRLVHGVLTQPRAVTDHGCLGPGPCPFALHAVLGTGTIVLTDPEAEFEPVVRCRSGTPLTPPECPPNCLPPPEESPTPTPEEDGTTTGGISRPAATPTPTPTEEPTAEPTPPPTEPPTEPPTGTGTSTATSS